MLPRRRPQDTDAAQDPLGRPRGGGVMEEVLAALLIDLLALLARFAFLQFVAWLRQQNPATA